ncbi:aromatic ring-hydroxylating oxygenase subunit alpha [Aspergillus candidus]|uniref:Choline monooxygenase, chloroplastic n=1 Tax=Aspergillus candidus TaxID=41067 RepID=A0A2I2FCB2_ASPCN|nr:iron-sulfur cluster-binding protein [Aspergillus candidus]PLB38274.1 iron-sulfur cluster-binding protein [Aspergillus candidus]
MDRLFSLGKSSTNQPDALPKDEHRALPALWYRSPSLFALERRAIFSKKWLVITHQVRFQNVGDYVKYDIAGYNIFVIKDRKGCLRAFHNVCRHRAYPVMEAGCGTARIIACKYHGWSYGLDGQLAKAPKYQDLEGFDKAANGLFPIHIHEDQLGFVWVNLEASPEPTTPWGEDFAGVDEQPRLQHFDLSEYHFDHQWEMMGDYNWKTLADNYNECYHCPTGHPAINGLSDLSKYYVTTDRGLIQHFNTNKEDTSDFDINSSFYFPNASITISSTFFYLMRCIPVSSSQTKMEYEVFRHKDASDEAFTGISELFKQVLREDKDLCNAAQTNLNAGVFTNGVLHPQAEKGPLYFQQVVRKLLFEHRQEEEKAGKEIWPAVPGHVVSDKVEEELQFCRSLDCSSAGSSLDW